MDRKELENLDKVLNTLEWAAVHLAENDETPEKINLLKIETAVMKSINMLDQLVPRPLPPKSKNEDNSNENKSAENS